MSRRTKERCGLRWYGAVNERTAMCELLPTLQLAGHHCALEIAHRESCVCGTCGGLWFETARPSAAPSEQGALL